MILQTENTLRTTSESPFSLAVEPSSAESTEYTPEQKQAAETFLMGLNRAERRKFEKKSKVKIPTTNKPFVHG